MSNHGIKVGDTLHIDGWPRKVLQASGSFVVVGPGPGLLRRTWRRIGQNFQLSGFWDRVYRR
jgi:hypothetical protein